MLMEITRGRDEVEFPEALGEEDSSWILRLMSCGRETKFNMKLKPVTIKTSQNVLYVSICSVLYIVVLCDHG